MGKDNSWMQCINKGNQQLKNIKNQKFKGDSKAKTNVSQKQMNRRSQ